MNSYQRGKPKFNQIRSNELEWRQRFKMRQYFTLSHIKQVNDIYLKKYCRCYVTVKSCIEISLDFHLYRNCGAHFM